MIIMINVILIHMSACLKSINNYEWKGSFLLTFDQQPTEFWSISGGFFWSIIFIVHPVRCGGSNGEVLKNTLSPSAGSHPMLPCPSASSAGLWWRWFSRSGSPTALRCGSRVYLRRPTREASLRATWEAWKRSPQKTLTIHGPHNTTMTMHGHNTTMTIHGHKTL